MVVRVICWKWGMVITGRNRGQNYANLSGGVLTPFHHGRLAIALTRRNWQKC